MIKKYGFTYEEILKDFKNIKLFKFRNDNNKYNSMDLVVSKTIKHLNKIVYKIKPDLFVIHGDRCETLAAAICCNLNNILLAHIEGVKFPELLMSLLGMQVLNSLIFILYQIQKQRKF